MTNALVETTTLSQNVGWSGANTGFVATGSHINLNTSSSSVRQFQIPNDWRSGSESLNPYWGWAGPISVSGSSEKTPSERIVLIPSQPSTDVVLASLPPRERISFLARRQPGELVLFGLSLVGGLYIVGRSLSEFGISLASLVTTAAAQTGDASHSAGMGFWSSRDAFDWYVALLMGIVLLSSLGMVAFAQTASKITFARESTRLIIGFIIGFLSGGRGR
jgi:hypothetical protein